jgi:hypothetical protein
MRAPEAKAKIHPGVRQVRAVLRLCLLVGLAAQAASVVVISYGIHLRTRSERFEEYQESVLAEMNARSQGRDSGPGIAVGMVLASTWWFVGCLMLLPLFILIFALFLLHVIAKWNRTVMLLGIGTLAVVCLIVVLSQSRSALNSFNWGFLTLRAGETFHAVGLVLTASGAPLVALRTWDSHHRPSCSAVV